MKDFLKVYWPLALFAIVAMIVALRFVEPAPPRTITMATGGPGGAYAAFGERYATLLEEHGVDLQLMQTAGSLENLRLITDGDADVALVQGGLAQPEDAERMLTLGGLFYEPFWVFARAETGARSFTDLRNSAIAVGSEGSGTRALAMHVRREFGGAWGANTDLALGGTAAAEALKAGEIDAAVFAADISAPYVDDLLKTPGIILVPFDRAPAMAQRLPALAPVTLLRGVVDVGADLPAQDVPVIAPVAQLVVSADLHPAIHAILLEAADDIHSDASLLAVPGTFPDADRTDLPLSKEAARYYRNGPSSLRRYFSFGVANFLERAWILLIPLVTLLIPLVRLAPPIYRWRVRRKIYVWYEDLRNLEVEGRAAEKNAEELEDIRTRLSRLQEEIGQLEVPLSYTDDLYRLRNHVAFVNQLLGNLDPAQSMGPPVA